MEDYEPSTMIQDIVEFDKCMKILKYQSAWFTDPIGYIVNNTTTDPMVTIIDKNESILEVDPTFFYNHELFQWPKVLLAEDGTVTNDSKDKYNGENLTLTGPLDVMTRIPNGQFYYRYESDADTQIYKWAPYDSNHRGFEYHPNCYAGGGTLHDSFFIGTYKAGLKDDNGTLKFNSCSGVQPWTGGQMRSVPFTSGNTEFIVGETITGTTSGATGTVVSWHKSSGDWSAGTAGGTVYLRNYGVDVSTATAFDSSEALTRTSGSASTNGSQAILSLTIDDALTYAANKGNGWTISGVYDIGWIQGLLYTMAGTRDVQTKWGKGVVNIAGSGYAGLLNGAGSIDSNINQYGTGIGDGIDGQCTIEVNNICDLWGNCLEFVTGINIMVDGTVRLTNPDGTKTVAGTLAEGTYITLPEKVPIQDGSFTGDGYISSVQKLSYDANQNHAYGALTHTPLTAGDFGSGSAAKCCDWWDHAQNDQSIIFSSGLWNSDLNAGIGYRSAGSLPSTSFRNISARLIYRPQ